MPFICAVMAFLARSVGVRYRDIKQARNELVVACPAWEPYTKQAPRGGGLIAFCPYDNFFALIVGNALHDVR
jgi:hypothetical protein